MRALARACSGFELTEVDGAVGAGLGSGSDSGSDSNWRSAFYLASDEPRAVGRALAWATSHDADRVEILAEGDAGDLARRAGLLSGENAAPPVRVWAVNGAATTLAEPTPAVAPPAIPDEHWALAAIMSEAGARPLDDHGVLIAEITGLEVGRVVDAPSGPAIEVGVGQADRELSHLVHSDTDPGLGLRRVITAVVEYRRPGSHHPLTRVGRDRWLRSLLFEHPDLIGAASLQPVVPLRARGGLKTREPAAAAGLLPSGRPVVVVTAAGVDLDLVPEAADYRDRTDPDAELVLAMPERDLKLNTGLLDRVPGACAVALEAPWL